MKRLLLSVLLMACAKSAPPPAAVTSPEPAPDASPGVPPLALEDSGPTARAPETTAPDAGAKAAAPQAEAAPAIDTCIPAAAELETAARVAMRTCYEDAAKKKPDLAGEVRIAVNVDARGKISSTKSLDKSTLGDKVVECIAKAIKATPFDGGKCTMRMMQIVHKYPH